MPTDRIDVHAAIEQARADERHDRETDMHRHFDQMDRFEQALTQANRVQRENA